MRSPLDRFVPERHLNEKSCNQLIKFLTKLCGTLVRVRQHTDSVLGCSLSTRATRKMSHLSDIHLDFYDFVQKVLHIFLYLNHLLHRQTLAILFEELRSVTNLLYNNLFIRTTLRKKLFPHIHD